MSFDIKLTGLDELIKATDPDIVDRSLSRAMRTGLQQGRTEVNRQIRQKLAIKLARINALGTTEIQVGKAGARSALIIRSASIPLSEFSPVKTARGFSIKLQPKSGALELKQAFQFPAAGNRLFQRTGEFSVPTKGRYAGKRYKREKIAQKFTRSFPQVIDDAELLANVTGKIEEVAAREFLRQLQVFGAKE